ncbi:DUF3237 family protein [Paenibacillus pabuli]|uniref:DUF3237 family protein n=1 Tax=Paenibacillus pabuli TaxID=1472 RepID=UPI000783AAC1|nr:DUF3237 family protein [Paenibacillus pabuli]MEC0123280.1 DUF3237 family protein [Paenibacillus pabuli]
MKWEEVFTVHVVIGETFNLQNDSGDSVVMISFTGHATGKYFQGIVLGGATDTQIIGQHGDKHSLSARYMLRGTDYTGQDCELYIENNGEIHEQLKGVLFRTSPRIITNSKALSFLNGDMLVGEGLQAEAGVDIKIYRAV